jgi:hypothetical protein
MGARRTKETNMKSLFKSARLGMAFALALGAAVPMSFIATPAAASDYHEMHRGWDHRGDHRGEFHGGYRDWHSDHGQFRHHRGEHGFWFGR